MKEIFKKIDLMIILFLICVLANLSGVVISFSNNNQSAARWAIASTLWCAATAAWYMRCKDGK